MNVPCIRIMNGCWSQAGFTLAAGPLRAMFVLEGITDRAAI